MPNPDNKNQSFTIEQHPKSDWNDPYRLLEFGIRVQWAAAADHIRNSAKRYPENSAPYRMSMHIADDLQNTAETRVQQALQRFEARRAHEAQPTRLRAQLIKSAVSRLLGSLRPARKP